MSIFFMRILVYVSQFCDLLILHAFPTIECVRFGCVIEALGLFALATIILFQVKYGNMNVSENFLKFYNSAFFLYYAYLNH